MRDGEERARKVVERASLVHRTVCTGSAANTLDEILAEGRLRANPPITGREHRCGIERALYFFLGCAAYPEGAVAFLASTDLLAHTPASYCPFDTGSLGRYSCPRNPDSPWKERDKRAFLADHLGHGKDALAFCTQYIAAHFVHVEDYVCRPQFSVPDFPTYHDLISTDAERPDRRAWSIEVQLQTDLELRVENLDAIVLGQSDLLADFPDELVETLVIAEDEGSITTTIQQHMLRESHT